MTSPANVDISDKADQNLLSGTYLRIFTLVLNIAHIPYILPHTILLFTHKAVRDPRSPCSTASPPTIHVFDMHVYQPLGSQLCNNHHPRSRARLVLSPLELHMLCSSSLSCYMSRRASP